MNEGNGLTPLGKYCTTARLYGYKNDWLRGAEIIKEII